MRVVVRQGFYCTLPLYVTFSSQEPKLCAVELRYGRMSSGMAFGDVRHSHAEIDVEKRSIKNA